jgi:hypothetical protein
MRKNTVGFVDGGKLNISKILMYLSKLHVYLLPLYMYATATASKKRSGRRWKRL